MFDNYCFYTATVVRRTLLSVTLHLTLSVLLVCARTHARTHTHTSPLSPAHRSDASVRHIIPGRQKTSDIPALIISVAFCQGFVINQLPDFKLNQLGSYYTVNQNVRNKMRVTLLNQEGNVVGGGGCYKGAGWGTGYLKTNNISLESP